MASINDIFKSLDDKAKARSFKRTKRMMVEPWGAGAGENDPMIELSATTIAENASVPSVVGILSISNAPGDWGTTSFAVTADPDTKFDIDNDVELIIDNTLNYETATSHNVTITATPSGPYDPIVRVFNIGVANVLETILNELTLDTNDVNYSDPQGTLVGTLSGKTSGSTLSLIDDDGGAFQLDGITIEIGAVTPTLGTRGIVVREIHADAAPNDSELTLDVADGDPLAPPAPTLDLVAASDSGSSDSDNITNDDEPAIDVTTEDEFIEDDEIEVEVNSVSVDTHTVTAGEELAGVVELGLAALSEGANSIRMRHNRPDGGDHWSPWSDALVITVDTTAPTLSGDSGVQLAQTTATLTVTTNEANGRLYYVVTTSATPPSAAQVKAGQDHASAAAMYAGSQSISSTGEKNATATGITVGTRYAYFMHEDAAGNQSSVAADDWSQADITAPVLSSPTASETSDTTADLAVTSTEASGTIYWVVSTSNTQPSIAQIKAGNDHTGSPAADAGSDTAATSFTDASTGLTAATTYYAHFVQTDAATNDSNRVTSASFTTEEESEEWSPADLGADLLAWYVADQGVYVDAGTTLATDGQTVRQWNDQSGNGYHLLQADSGLRPTFDTTGLDGQPAVLFDAGTTTYMATATDSVAMGSVTTSSAFAVAQLNTASVSFGRLVTYTGTGEAQDYNNNGSAIYLLRNATNNQFCSHRNGNTYGTTNISLDTSYSMGSIWDGTNVTTYLDNVAGTPAANTMTFVSPGRINVGADNGSLSAWEGPVSEVVITKTALDATARNNLLAYFQSKWGI
jgi:hypothetical protein